MVARKHEEYQLVGKEYINQGGYLEEDLMLVCYSTKDGKGKKSAHNQFGSEGPYRIYWEDVPGKLYVSEERIRSSSGARNNPKWLKRHLTWAGCGRAVGFGRIDYEGNEVSNSRLSWTSYSRLPWQERMANKFNYGYTTFRRCERKADYTGFCKGHKTSAIKDFKVKTKDLFIAKLFPWLLR